MKKVIKWCAIAFCCVIALVCCEAFLEGVAESDTNGSSTLSEGKMWEIKTEKDEMTDKENVWATLTSSNYIKQDFPYQGETYARICVRYMSKYGNDVIISIDKGQIYGGNKVVARFDDGQPIDYTFSEPSDGSSEDIFINNKSSFIAKCKTAKEIKIEIPIYEEGMNVFTFNVDSVLVWEH